MSEAAKVLFGDKLLDIIRKLFPNLNEEEYFKIENKIFCKIMDNDFSSLCVSKLDDSAHNLAIMAMTYIGGFDVPETEWRKRWPKANTKREKRKSHQVEST